MNILPDPLGYVIIEDTFEPRELDAIWSAIDHIQSQGLFQSPDQTGSAIDPRTGQLVKRNRSIFLEDLEAADRQPDIRSLTAGLWTNAKITRALTQINPTLSIWRNLNYSTHLVSYYETGESYPPHRDRSVFTILTWLYREPQQWQGGEFELLGYDRKFQVKNNQSIIMPGSFLHQAYPVEMMTAEPGQGRYCLAQFGYVKP
jgi:hypothetical protein